SSNGRLDALGKSVAEFLRARHLDIPRRLLTADASGRATAGAT
ncbi:MAG: hypothetical protein JWO02_4406, partial [Solirubrobacterales bacterium]|nr:hypothetical protein [Solirubrobacterales bacterium]